MDKKSGAADKGPKGGVKKAKPVKSSVDGSEDDRKSSSRQADILDEAAMKNALNICHNVQDLLYFRGFFWDGQAKKGKTKKKKGKR